MEKANDFIELAEDESLNGDPDKALDYYYQALDELRRVQVENPERAEKPEFAPLRNKIATCRAAVDTIRFEQINANIRAVSVTDTTELQRKWNKRHGVVEPEEPKYPDATTPAPQPEKAQTTPKKPPQEKSQEKPQEPPQVKPQEETPEMQDGWNDRLREAAKLLRANENAAAEAILSEMDESRPNDLNVMVMRAAALAGTGRLYAARKILEQAAKAHPKSYLPLYNLAYVVLELGEGRNAARLHYERGRELGGPVNADMERRLKND
jgi:tetratricopeptide (TPR) repeat protein